MESATATLIVRRVGGLFQQAVLRGSKVLLDRRRMGVVGEKISIPAGSYQLTVKTPWFTCNSLDVAITPGSSTVLEYRSNWLAYLSIVLGCFLFMTLSALSVAALVHLEFFIEAEVLSPLLGLILLVGIVGVHGWLAFAGPLFLLSRLGIHSHRLTCSPNPGSSE
jgi:hypothetical protein